MRNVRDDLKAVYTAAIEAVNPAAAVKGHMKKEGGDLVLMSGGKPFARFALGGYRRVILVGSGKATAPMAGAAEEILGDRISAGCVTVKYGYTQKLSRTTTIEASHPVPDENGIRGAAEIRALLKEAGRDDLVVSLISGGGSALLPLPAPPVTLEEKRDTTNLLLRSGASIHETNAVRKHLSLVKGGNLARAAFPATVVNLMMSDVVGDDMDVIASGPFVPDRSTFAGAAAVLEKYRLMDKIPRSAMERLLAGTRGEVEENPQAEDPVFRKVTNLIIASNLIALRAGEEEARRRGYNTLILSSLMEGETRDVAFFHAAIAKEVLASSHPVGKPACIISGGETTVMVKGEGLGGRNMEFALHAAKFIQGREGVTMASVGTDGSDGPTDAAGAVADGGTVARSRERGLDMGKYIDNNDSYHFFQETGDLIVTGPTNTNVMDIRIMLMV